MPGEASGRSRLRSRLHRPEGWPPKGEPRLRSGSQQPSLAHAGSV